MTRKSKIARLPRPIRDELNHRLDNGHAGLRLVEWLNSLPEVKEVLAREFQGHRITPQNLSQWKRGGYQDWAIQQEQAATLHDFLADAKELGQAASPEKLTEAVSNFTLVHYAAAMQRYACRPEQRDNLNRYSQMLNDVIRLRNCDLARERFELDTQKLAFNAEKLEIQTQLANLRLELDRERLELARQKAGMQLQDTPNRSADIPVRSKVYNQEAQSSSQVRAASPPTTALPGRSMVPTPGGAKSQAVGIFASLRPGTGAVQRATSGEVRPPQAATSLHISCPVEVGCSKNPLEINSLQPNPAKSNHPFFIFSHGLVSGTGVSPVCFDSHRRDARATTPPPPVSGKPGPENHEAHQIYEQTSHFSCDRDYDSRERKALFGHPSRGALGKPISWINKTDELPVESNSGNLVAT